jgi:hypothetical protein
MRSEKRTYTPENALGKRTYTPENALRKRTYTPEKQLSNEANKKTEWASRSFCVLKPSGRGGRAGVLEQISS